MNDFASISDRLELFFGDASAAEARVYARLPGVDSSSAGKLEGQLIGPECSFARTLPAKIPFQFRGRGPGGELLAEAIVPDPCCWTPELPMLYRVEVGARGEGRGAREEGPGARGQGPGEGSVDVRRWFGIRRLGVRGAAIYLDGKRWVLRGVLRNHVEPADLAAARAADAALGVSTADDELCLEASRQGVPLAVFVPGRGIQALRELRRLGRWPAVFLAVLDREQPADFDPRWAARNLLFAVRCRAGEAIATAPWAHALWCEIAAGQQPGKFSENRLPIIAVRPLDNETDLLTARVACDQLQSDLAPLGDFAGYMV